MTYIYLDYAATTPTDPRVLKAMIPYFKDIFGNASSLHSFGQEAKKAIDQAREQVAALIKSNPGEIIFTSGGTEADNLAIKGLFYALNRPQSHIITSAIEHPAVLKPCHFLEKQGARITYLPVDKQGLVNPDDLCQTINDETILVSTMHANNEIGTIQPIKQIGEIVKAEKDKREKNKNKCPIYFHTDAVQTLGHLPIDVNELGVDMLSMSSHKLYGPKGVGALYVGQGIKLTPWMHGGEQERNRRASTENLPGIVGFGKACQIAAQEFKQEAERLKELRDYLINQILSKIKYSQLNGHPEKRLPNNVNVSIKGVEGEGMLMSLDLVGVACSTGSACSSSILEPSHVLLALGLAPEVAHSSLRFTLGKWTKKKDLDYTIEHLVLIVERLRKISPLKDY